MIFLFHGENFTKSRETVIKLQKRLNSNNKIELNISVVTANEFREACASFDIFSEPPFVVLNISKLGRKNPKDYVKALEQIPSKTTLIIISEKELSKTNAILKKVLSLNGKVILNKLVPTSNVFKLIDALYEKSRQKTYRELRLLLLEDIDPFYLFSMIQYGLRNIAHAKLNSPSFSKISPFVKSKAKKQSENFTQEDIINLYSEFYKIDKKLKTGFISPDFVISYTIEKVLN